MSSARMDPRIPYDDTVAFVQNEKWDAVPKYLTGQPCVVKIDFDSELGTHDINFNKALKKFKNLKLFFMQSQIVHVTDKAFVASIMKIGDNVENSRLEWWRFSRFCLTWMETSTITHVYYPDFKFDNLAYVTNPYSGDREIRFIDLNDVITLETCLQSSSQKSEIQRVVISTFVQSVQWQWNHLINKDPAVDWTLRPTHVRNFLAVHQFYSIVQTFIIAAHIMGWGDKVVLDFFCTCLQNEKYGVPNTEFARAVSNIDQMNKWLVSKIRECFERVKMNRETTTIVQILDSEYRKTPYFM